MELIDGVVRNYNWGQTDYIPRWLGETPDGRPWAELWFGAHPSAPSTIQSTGRTLEEVVADDTSGVVGEGRDLFPFLAKILAAGAPLSLQVHPDSEQAEEGYRRENAAGLAPDAPDRTYRDASAKPELVCALTPFTAKCGLRALGHTRQLLDLIPTTGLDELRAVLATTTNPAIAYDAAIRYLFSLDDSAAGKLAAVVTEAAGRVPSGSGFDGEIEWTGRLAQEYPGDIGIVIGLLLNHVVLQPGQALFLGAGNMHSYMEGVAVEVMAPSDNVVRGGLTTKHMDTDELLNLLDTRPVDPQVQQPSAPVHRYAVGDDAFGLTRLSLRGDDTTVELTGPAIAIVTDATLRLTAQEEELRVRAGQAVLIRADDGPVVATGSGTAHVAHAG